MSKDEEDWNELREDYISNVLNYINRLQSTSFNDLTDLSLQKALADGRYYIAAASVPLNRFMERIRHDAFVQLANNEAKKE